jgi:hypothetical protein
MVEVKKKLSAKISVDEAQNSSINVGKESQLAKNKKFKANDERNSFIEHFVNYNVFSFLFNWIFPNKNSRSKIRNLCRKLEADKQVPKIQSRYENIVKKLRKQKGKMRVLFLVNEISKWKAQSLYDLMALSEDFEPVIVLTVADIQRKFSLEQKKEIINSNFESFLQKGMNVQIAFDTKRGKAIDLKTFNPSIVFYQQPYNIPKNQDVDAVSKYALTYYVPYYLPDYKNFKLDCGYDFHHKLYRFYVLNKELESIYKKHLNRINTYSGNIYGLGHPMLDLYKNLEDKSSEYKYVIYAPHWSICHKNNSNNINISTFDINGKYILEYAKQHPEINWVFKPHPTLKNSLKQIGEMSQDEIDKYYSDWEEIAVCCYNSDYLDLFSKSKVLITDCGSFLMEYFCTGKPIIHLISANSTHVPYPQMSEIFNSFYQVYSNSRLERVLDTVVVNDKDFYNEDRIELLNKFNFTQNNAAENILKDISETLGRN